EGIRRVSLDGAARGLPPDDADDADEATGSGGHFEMLTRPEEIAVSLRNAGKPTVEIARELGLPVAAARLVLRSEEHTSELQSPSLHDALPISKGSGESAWMEPPEVSPPTMRTTPMRPPAAVATSRC